MTKNEVPKDLSTDGQHAPFKRNPYSRIRNIHLLSVWLSEEKNIDEVRALILRKMAGIANDTFRSGKVDLARLPPCKSRLIPHIRRANLRVYQWKQSHDHFPELPPPTSHGWEMDDN